MDMPTNLGNELPGYLPGSESKNPGHSVKSGGHTYTKKMIHFLSEINI